MTLQHFPEAYFGRHDERSDALFYKGRPRETYLSESAAAALETFLGGHLPERGRYIDLLAGRKSYIPGQLQPAHVAGLGLVQAELEDNPQLDDLQVIDLNRTARLPFDDEGFDACLCISAIQYLTRPVEIFQQVNRVLRPGGSFFVAFSSNCFPEKAIAIWLITSAEQRQALVKRYFRVSGGWTGIKTWQWPGPDGQEEAALCVVWARKAGG